MYGLVNQAVREMVITHYGEAKWEAIRERAGSDDVFVAMDQYPDQVTLDLVAGACEELGARPEQVLEAFGEYWVGFTGRAYGALFDGAGESFVDFVKSLNDLHTRVGQMMPDLTPPSFVVTDQQPGSFVLRYYSSRAGLHPMLHGLLRGLGSRFGCEVESTRLRGREDGLDHDQFLVRYRIP